MGNCYSDRLRVALVTNAGPSNITLEDLWVEWEENGEVVTQLAVLWGGTNSYSAIDAKGVMPVPFDVPAASPRFRICFHNSRAAGAVRRAAAPLVRKVVGNRFATPSLVRLRNSGWADGLLHFTYEGIWQTNQPANILGKAPTL
jgi:hypothetical protein